MEKVYVLMSAYNGKNYIDEQIKSILNQRGVKVHLYIRDDGSKDGTRECLKKWAAQDNITIILGENLGYGKSFMELVKCVPLEEGYYAFSDQDDIWIDNKLLLAIDQLKKYNYPATYCASPLYVDENLEKTDEYHLVIDDYPTGKISCEWGLVTGIWGLGCTMVWNLHMCRILKKANYKDFNFGHDNFLSVLAPLVGEFYKDSKKVLLYRQHGKNTGGSKKKKVKILDLIKEKYKNFKNPNMYILRKFVLEQFGDILSTERKKLLKDTVDYRKGFFKKIELLKKRMALGLGRREQIKYLIMVFCKTY